MKDDPGLWKLLQDTRCLLNFHRHCGLVYPLSDEIKSFLAPTPPIKSSLKAKIKTKDSSPAGIRQSLPSTVSLEDLKREFSGCRRCPLGEESGRMMFFGEGPAKAPPLCIICPHQNADEKDSNQAITGEARELLAKMLGAIDLRLDHVFLTNTIKCTSAKQYSATSEQAAACLPILLRQIEVIKPKILCIMDQLAIQMMLKINAPLHALRGKFYNLNVIPLMPTFHPSLLLKNPELKKGSWHDLLLIRKKLAALAEER
ncbi:MAG: uracil-DNA glycosylase [Pseudomonadota bacterium]